MATYGDISPRTAAYVAAKMLARAEPYKSMANFGQQVAIPKNKTNAVKFRRYNALAPNTTPLIEGVTPAPDDILPTDVLATLQQYGRYVPVTDVVLDTHEDPILVEYGDIMGEVAGQTQELVIFNAIKAGTNVTFAGGTSRATVSSAVTATELNRALRALKRQNARTQLPAMKASTAVGTLGVRPAFVAFVHPDMQTNLEAIPGWKEVSTYPNVSPWENEIGSWKDIRFVASTLYSPFLAAGASGSTLLTNGTTGTGPADVYPIIIVGKNAFGTVTLGGPDAVMPMVSNAKVSDSDPLAQRAKVGFKMYSTAVVLNDAWMHRIEAGVTQ